MIKEYPVGIRHRMRSYSIFVDNTVNREKKFLVPVARFAEWDRPDNYKHKHLKKRPKVAIRHHLMTLPEQGKVHELLLALDKSIDELQFLPAGLIPDRGDPEGLNYDAGPRDIGFMRTNWTQTIEFAFGGYNDQNRGIEAEIRKLMSLIRELCADPMKTCYREKYYRNVFDLDEQESWWTFRPSAPPKGVNVGQSGGGE